jgi:hypothetical protein
VRVLQKAGFLITPKEHARHHSGGHDDHYCVVTGWMNPLLDRTGFWRGLERLVHAVTGAVPRASEEEWWARYHEDPSFMRDPLPTLFRLRAERDQTGAAKPPPQAVNDGGDPHTPAQG